MLIDYTGNYLRIYFWKFFSIITGFLSLLIIIPHLSSNQEIFGVYSLCMSFMVYLSYADIGFLNAGQKFAAEQFSIGNKNEEYKIFGFTFAIFILLSLLFSFGMIYLAYYPELIMNGLTNESKKIAKSIFLILGLLYPFKTVLNRSVESILVIRVKDYISKPYDIAFNILKILSVFIFFAGERYMIVEYFLFFVIMDFIKIFILIRIIKKTEQYQFLRLIKSIKLSNKYYNITKKLAFSSLFSTIGYFLYFELDLIIIGKWFSLEDVSIYAVGYTFLSFIRTLWAAVFSPYAQRFNHLNSDKSIPELKVLISNIIEYTMPLCLIVNLTLFLISDKLVISWVGIHYVESIFIFKILALTTTFNFITQPASHFFSAKLKYKYIILIGFSQPLIFYLCTLIIAPITGASSLAISKGITSLFVFLFCSIGLYPIINLFKIFKKKSSGLLLVLLLILVFVIDNIFSLFLFNSKSTLKLVLLLIGSGLIIVSSYLFFILADKKRRKEIKLIFYEFWS
jgi:O-antigen/teichoic acid export membrane protein